MATWLQEPVNAATVSGSLLEAAAAAVDLVGDDDVHRLLHDEVERAVRAVPFGPLAGRVLQVGVAEGRHRPLVDGLLHGIVTFLDEQREPLRARFGTASPWWLPGAVEDRIFDRVLDGARTLLAAVAADPHHDLRREVDQRLLLLAERLEHDAELGARADRFVAETLGSADARAWTRVVWADLRSRCGRPPAARPTPVCDRGSHGPCRRSATGSGDEALARAPRGAVDAGAVRFVAEHHRDEISALVSATVARWDPVETSDKLELLLGRDLQFIRINGTVVGGLAGLAIHAVVDLLR